jgi:transposase
MLRQAPKVWLSQEQRDDLERFARSRTLPVRLVERAQIALRAAVGWDNQEIAEAMGLCRQTVGRWRERLATEGLPGLEDRPRAGRPRRILEPTIAEVVRLTTQTTPVAATHWSTRTLAPVTVSNHLKTQCSELLP